MAETDLDWTFDNIPTDGPAPANSPRRPPEARSRPASPVRARRWGWRLPAVLLGLVLAGALAAVGVYRAGWQRLRDQLAHEIAYEDAQSLARNVSAVDALHTWGTEDWRKRRRAEAAAGLAAPQPAESLLPLAEPPRLGQVKVLEPNLYEASVLRRYADSAGQIYTFALAQRYRSIGAGLWARLPPPEPDPAQTATWAGRRISVTYPLADQAWMALALPQIDAYLIAACADWGCPEPLRLPLAFTGQVAELPRVSVVQRPAGLAELGGYPIIFDLSFRTPRYPRRVLLASPQLAGQPVDESASQALVRAITADLLGQIAADLTVSNRAQYNIFLDALVARAEARLGLSTLPTPRVTPANYVPVTELWREVTGNWGSARAPQLAPRLQAAWFLEAVVGDRLASADASLLDHLRWSRSLPVWLEDSLRLDGQEAVDAWETQVQAQLAAAAPADWGQLSGLAYTCADGVWLVRAGRPERLPLDPYDTRLQPHALSPDGRYLAVGVGPQLQLLDLADLSAHPVAQGPLMLLGWSASGKLVYLERELFDHAGAYAMRISAYDPASGAWSPLSDAPILPPVTPEASWSARHEVLSFSLLDERVMAPATAQPAVVDFRSAAQVQPLPVAGLTLAVSPDARSVAYAALGGQPAGVDLRLMDLATGATVELLPAALDVQLSGIANLAWSPGGAWLAMQVVGASGERALMTLRLSPNGAPLAGAAPEPIPGLSANAFPLGFSADGRYLALADRVETGTRLLALELETGQMQPLLESGASSPLQPPLAGGAFVAWSPAGHQIAVAGPGKLFVADPATGRNQWIIGGDCSPAWYALP